MPEKSSIKSSRTIRLRDIDSAGFTDHVLLSNKVNLPIYEFSKIWSVYDPNRGFFISFQDCGGAVLFCSVCLMLDYDSKCSDDIENSDRTCRSHRFRSDRRRSERSSVAVYNGKISFPHCF